MRVGQFEWWIGVWTTISLIIPMPSVRNIYDTDQCKNSRLF